MKYERVILTNNPLVEKIYSNEDQVIFMDEATPHEVYCAAKELLEKGGRLIKPYFYNKTDFYTTVGVFFDGTGKTTPWNLREIESACRATQGISSFKGKQHSKFAQFMDKRHNAPERKAK